MIKTGTKSTSILKIGIAVLMLVAILFTAIPAPQTQATTILRVWSGNVVTKFELTTNSNTVYTIYPASTSYWVGYNYNTSGYTVKVAQAYCRAAGYSVGSAGVDGKYGNGTYTGVFNYQSNASKNTGVSLSADGTVGANTWRNMAIYYGANACSYL